MSLCVNPVSISSVHSLLFYCYAISRKKAPTLLGFSIEVNSQYVQERDTHSTQGGIPYYFIARDSYMTKGLGHSLF